MPSSSDTSDRNALGVVVVVLTLIGTVGLWLGFTSAPSPWWQVCGLVLAAALAALSVLMLRASEPLATGTVAYVWHTLNGLLVAAWGVGMQRGGAVTAVERAGGVALMAVGALVLVSTVDHARRFKVFQFEDAIDREHRLREEADKGRNHPTGPA